MEEDQEAQSAHHCQPQDLQQMDHRQHVCQLLQHLGQLPQLAAESPRPRLGQPSPQYHVASAQVLFQWMLGTCGTSRSWA
jgi:hypothetical protein